MMHSIHLTKTNPAENMCKFFDLHIAEDVLGGLNLCTARGRIGRTPLISVHSSGDEERLLANMCRETKLRIRHGYVLREANVPNHVKFLIEDYARSRRKIFSTTTPSRHSNVFFDIHALSNLSGTARGPDSFTRALDEFCQMVDPQRGRKAKRGREASSASQTGELFPASSAPAQFGTVSSDARREIVRRIARVMLEHDPRTLGGVLRALSPPSHVAGRNVVFIDLRREKRRHLMQVSLFEVLANDSALAQIAHVMADSGVRTLGELVTWEPELLRSRFGLSLDVLRDLDAHCGRYGLQLGMTLPVATTRAR